MPELLTSFQGLHNRQTLLKSTKHAAASIRCVNMVCGRSQVIPMFPFAFIPYNFEQNYSATIRQKMIQICVSIIPDISTTLAMVTA